MTMRNLARATAWIMLAVIVVLSLVPPLVRPTTRIPHYLEHAAAFSLTGMAFGVAYLGYQRWLLNMGAVAFCAAIELAQLMVPGRHARVKDFVVDAVAASIGIFAGPLMIRWSGRDTLRSNRMEL
jgi:VanZ family protein